MAGVFRAFGLLISAIGVECWRGVGIAALAAAMLVGWRRWPVLALPAVIAGGAILSLTLPEPDATTGKVLHSLSNAAFVLLIHGVIALIGYAAGRLIRRAQI